MSIGRTKPGVENVETYSVLRSYNTMYYRGARISSLKSINRRCYRVAIRGRTPKATEVGKVAGRNPALSHLVSRTGLGLAKALSPHAQALFILQPPTFPSCRSGHVAQGQEQRGQGQEACQVWRREQRRGCLASSRTWDGGAHAQMMPQVRS